MLGARTVFSSISCTVTSLKRFVQSAMAEVVCDHMEPDSQSLLQSSGLSSVDEIVELDRTPMPSRKRHKFAMFLGYSGAAYRGMQMQTDDGIATVENDMFEALVRIGMINENDVKAPKNFIFQRCARTDAGVSAVRQLCSLLLNVQQGEEEQFVSDYNLQLPKQIRCFGLIRTTKSFDSKKFCASRSYAYTLPTYSFAQFEKKTTDDFRLSAEQQQKVNDVLGLFVGTHNFFNFTSGRQHGHESSKRYIMECYCKPPYIVDGIEYACIVIRGQSFVQHQIRKVVGLTLAIVRGHVAPTVVQDAWQPERIDVPRAPGLGLVLECVHHDYYNQKFGTTHTRIEWSEYEEAVESFRNDVIMPVIYEKEKTERVMLNWLETLFYHSFDASRLSGESCPLSLVAKRVKLEREGSLQAAGGDQPNLHDKPSDES